MSTSIDTMDRAARRRLRYRVDAGYRQACINSSLRALGLPIKSAPRKAVWTLREVASVLGTTTNTLVSLERLSIVPRATYPAKVRMYWSYQVLLLAKLFSHMKDDGWPVVKPRPHGRAYWTDYLTRLQQDWRRKGYEHVEWKTRSRHIHQGNQDC